MKVIDEILESYPAKVMKNRKGHMLVKGEGCETGGCGKQKIDANSRTMPGVMTNRGCAYAGCKGVVLGPLKDMIHIVHGPIGCSYYAWGTRRNKGRINAGEQNFLNYAFSTDMQDSDVVFGGEKKLDLAIKEAVETFHPKAITISATCPVGLIGDDINAAAARAQKAYGIPVLAFSCEGYKGVSQSAGHHIANNKLMRDVIGKNPDANGEGFSINILGEYNIGGDGWEIGRILSKIGYKVMSIMTGDGTYEDLTGAHKAKLNIVQCHRSINYIAEMLEKKYGTPWLKVNFIGVEATMRTLRDMATYFGDAELTAKTEAVIKEEYESIQDDMADYKEMVNGKKACLFVGGSRSDHYQELLKDIGVSTILAGFEFAHRDDYEGRDIIPDIKIDADSRNIEELAVEKDEKNYKLYLTPEQYEELKTKIPLGNYEGLISLSENGTVIVDDLNHFETEKFINALKPDLFASGIKDKYMIQKMGVFSKQLHSYDYSGPYAGFRGAVNFARDIAMGITSPTWKLVTPPWKVVKPLTGTVAVGGDL